MQRFGDLKLSTSALIRTAFDCSNLLFVNTVPNKKPLNGGLIILRR